MSTPKIRIALAGLGFGAEFIPIYQAHPNAEIVAICQRNPEKLKAIGDRYKIAKRYTDFDALLKILRSTRSISTRPSRTTAASPSPPSRPASTWPARSRWRPPSPSARRS